MNDEQAVMWLWQMYYTMPLQTSDYYRKLEALHHAIEVLESRMQSNMPTGGADG